MQLYSYAMQFANRHIGYHLQIQLVPRRASPNFSIWGDGQKNVRPPNSAAIKVSATGLGHDDDDIQEH